jgi:myosin-crossreactive antigen
MRVTNNQGKDAHTPHKFTLSDQASMEKAMLFMAPERELDDKKITDVFSEDAVRTGMEAVYTPIDIRRGVPEVFDSAYDVRSLLKEVELI